MKQETLDKANEIDCEIEALQGELDEWEDVENGRQILSSGRVIQRHIPSDVFVEFKRKCKEHLQKLIDTKRAELAAL